MKGGAKNETHNTVLFVTITVNLDNEIKGTREAEKANKNRLIF